MLSDEAIIRGLTSLSGWRYFFTALLGAFLISTIVPPLAYQESLDVSSRRFGLDGDSLNRDLVKLVTHLGSVQLIFFNPIIVLHIKHQISKQLTLGHVCNLVIGKAASCNNGGMWSNDTGRPLQLPGSLMENRPGFFKVFCCGGTSENILQISRCGISTVGETYKPIEGSWFVGQRLERNVALGWCRENKGSLADDVVAVQQARLIDLNPGIIENRKKSEKAGIAL